MIKLALLFLPLLLTTVTCSSAVLKSGDNLEDLQLLDEEQTKLHQHLAMHEQRQRRDFIIGNFDNTNKNTALNLIATDEEPKKATQENEDSLFTATSSATIRFMSMPPTKSPTRNYKPHRVTKSPARPSPKKITRSPAVHTSKPTIKSKLGPTNAPVKISSAPVHASVPTRTPIKSLLPIKVPTTKTSRPAQHTKPSTRPASPLAPVRRTPAPARRATPTPTRSLVCDGISMRQRTADLLGIVSSVSGKTALDNPTTSQHAAFEWLVHFDASFVCPEKPSHVIQRYVAALLYYSTNGDSWDTCSALPTSPCQNTARFLSKASVCMWYHVSCINDKIASFTLDSNHLKGQLPAELKALTNLRVLDFGGNLLLSSRIPASFGQLHELIQLNLTDSNIQGGLPLGLFDATSLQVVDLSKSDITGTIPTEIMKLIHLDIFNIAKNKVVGAIPASLPRSLRFFIADSNGLTGPLPSSLAKNTNLRVLSVGSNALTGALPSFVGDSLLQLETINLFENHFKGTIPSSLGKLVNLKNLFLHFNNFTGTMPAAICALHLNQLTADCKKVQCTCCTLCF